jgi:hypothetical protein
MNRFGRSMVKVHPTTCTCRMCKKKKKQFNKENRYVVGFGWSLFILLIVLGSCA